MAEAAALLGKPIAERIRSRILAEVPPGLRPCLAVVVASDDAAVARYAAAKQRTADALGLGFRVETVDPAGGQAALDARIAALSADPGVHGILLELPLAAGLDVEIAIRQLDPLKDVDGLTPHNLGLIAAGREADALLPATPAACIQLAETVADLKGARAVVVGRGRAVGRALAPMLVNRDATVTVCHSRTRDLAAAIAAAAIVFVAAGRPGLVGAAMVRPGQVVVDAGISVVDGRVVGDVDADSVRPIVAALTPVPGGVGGGGGPRREE
ncbi:bifunctional 5,10-methylenetetrahydrofolate dehydrogenase/5,10-methenyltetrahydrofolate cyclohydrolase, partial [Inquilinus sp. OTU3971]|uniref:bifunctional 5,10-methylenetetrahydrofolate dehydrogenase/5,10-methenyltetrahydrofolate cyclohydrolase n=1 Tax=Inquilinus sp. OTU3971 TaxID=3043855 RepID=UPI00313EC5F1